MPLYKNPYWMAHVVNGEELAYVGGVVQVHTEQDWAEIVDLDALSDLMMTNKWLGPGSPAPTKRIQGVFFVLDRNGRRNPPPEDP